MSRVCMAATDGYFPDSVQRAVNFHFEQLQLDQLLHPGMKVLLKPNLLMKRLPSDATTTHPELMRAIIRRLKQAGITDIVIADSPGGPFTKPLLQAIYRTAGMEQVAEEESVALNYNLEVVNMQNPDGEVCRSFPILQVIADADLIIDVAKMKTHCMTMFSGAVKNLFGCIPGLTKPEYHYRFPEKEDFCNMLVDLCQLVKPSISFVDAIDAMEGDGPSGGTIRSTNLIFASTNPYLLDYTMCRCIGIPTEQVLYLNHALRRGLLDPDALQVIGNTELYEHPVAFKLPASKQLDFLSFMPQKLRKPIKKVMNRILEPRPVIHRKSCIGCGKCAESCPAHTIDIKDKKAYIRYKNCIHCFCCHEMCPVKTISVKSFVSSKTQNS